MFSTPAREHPQFEFKMGCMAHPQPMIQSTNNPSTTLQTNRAYVGTKAKIPLLLRIGAFLVTPFLRIKSHAFPNFTGTLSVTRLLCFLLPSSKFEMLARNPGLQALSTTAYVGNNIDLQWPIH